MSWTDLSPEAPSYYPLGVHGLEIGGGTHPRRLGFRQFDAIDWSGCVCHSDGRPVQYELGDARQLPYEDGEFDYVFASNLLEHFPASETVSVLTEWARVLCVGGVLELVVPDSIGILRAYFTGENSWPECQERLLGSKDYPGNEHFACFTISEFPAILAQVPALRLEFCKPSHGGCGVHSASIKTEV